MKNHLRLLALPLLLAVAACQPGAAEYSGAEAPKLLTLDNAGTQMPVSFAAGAAQLAPGEQARLDRLVLAGRITPSDRVSVAAGGDPALQHERVAAIQRELLRYGIAATANPIAGIPPNRALVIVGRYLVTLPQCPDWSRRPYAEFTNFPDSNFGCATATNLGLMVASPSDLISGRPLGLADGRTARTAVEAALSGNAKSASTYNDATSSAIAAATTGSGGGTSGGTSSTGR